MGDLTCFYRSRSAMCGPSVGHLVELRSTGSVWARPVCALHAADRHRRQPTYRGDAVVFLTDLSALRWRSTCGAWRVVAIGGAAPHDERWCERITGPCPLPNTAPGATGDRRACAAEVEAGLGGIDFSTLPSLE